MSIFDQEKNLLPGVTTEVELTFNEDFDTSLWGTTESVLVIGTAFDGPVNKPVRLYSPEYAKFVFGEPYNPISKKEATLVREFLDIWDRGGRTIWGVRVSGKPLYKDFQLATTDEYKLRISSTFPSNANKNCYFTYDNAFGNKVIKIYKPKEKATMSEKSRGLVDGLKAMIEFDLNLSNYDINDKTPISELITRFNGFGRNNVLRMSIVDKDGNDVTNRMDIINDIETEALFPGAYFIGRDRNRSYASTDLRYELRTELDELGEERIKVYKDLIINSDVKKDLPIYAKELKMLNKSFIDVGVIMTEMFDFLSNYKTVNKVFQMDRHDYEEVDLTDFELYKKLGSGYAITAVAETRGREKEGKTDIKVVESKLDDPNRVVAIKEGIYPTIENLDTDYRVLAGGYADKIIRNRIPRKSDFKRAKPNSEIIFNDTVKVTTKVDPKDIDSHKEYTIELDAFSPEDDITKDILKEGNLYKEQSITHVPTLTIDFEEGLTDSEVLKTLEKFDVVKQIEDGTVFLLARKGVDGKAVLCKKDGKQVVSLNKIEMKGKFLYSNGSLFVGTSEEDEEEKAKTTFKAPEGKEFKNPKFMVAGLMNEAGTAQKPATIDEVFEFFKKAQPVYELDSNGKPVIKDGKPVQIGERPSVNFKKENIKITKDEVKVTGQIFTKADWAKIKGTPNANPDIPYRMTILYGSDKQDKACKLVITEDGYATIDDLGQHESPKEDIVPEKPLNKQERKEFGIAKEVGEEVVFFKECEALDIDKDAKYFIIDSNGNINIYKIDDKEIEAIGSLKDIVSDDEDKTLIIIEDVITLPTEFDDSKEVEEIAGIKIANKSSENLINITSSAFDYMTLDDLLLFLSEYPGIRSKFEFELTKAGVMIKDEYIVESIEDGEKISNIFYEEKDEEGNPLPIEGKLSSDSIVFSTVGYDTNLHIPFKTTDNFARHLAQHCTSTSLKTGDTHGIIGVTPLTSTDLASVADRVDELLATNYDLFAKKENGRAMLNNITGEVFDIGDKVSIVVGQYPVITGSGYRTISNGAGGYAGMVSSLPLDRSSTNQPIAIEALDFELSNYQLANLTQKGYVTFKDSYTKGIVVTDGVTCARTDSPLRRLSSVKILKAVKDLIRRKTEPFIGMRDNLSTIASIETAIETDMSKLKDVLLRDYYFEVRTPKQKAKLGIIDIYFSIVPFNEVRNINSYIRVVDEITATVNE